MIANYHTHTWRCKHAHGTEEEYVRCAIKKGLSILGFSDHAPHFFPDGYVSRIRMLPEQLQDYADTIGGLQQQYQDQIQIHLGLEMEFYPELFEQMLPYYRDHGINYLVLAQHYLDNEVNAANVARPASDREEFVEKYCNQLINAMQTGAYTYLAHPDVLNFVGQPEVYKTHMRRLCKEAKQVGMPLELNLSGFNWNRYYPSRRFWEIAAEEGCQVVLGVDAHFPEELLDEPSEKQAMQWIRELELPLLETLELKKF